MRQALGNGGLADARLADEHRVVLGPARQHLDGAADFLVAPDHGIELARPRLCREVAGIFLQRVVALLGRRTVGGAALAQIGDDLVERLRGDAGLLQHLGRRAGCGGERQQHVFDGDELIAGFLRHLLGLVEHARGFRREINLARGIAFDPRQLVELAIDGLRDLRCGAARGIDQVAGETVLVLQQRL